ncbi:TetR/AcrR family transcriptional regulator [Rheinheimera sediminis]|jgi:AcrR family transcriptional regulator|uniref:TetR/AcrR family transcriptional regulator n=1 Tax=Rheinheimera sp. YQF-1 TaxID=2499626 RepID=UPI000FD95365|nr:TetR/AcrR family transcriptional regulator [Rheinheimera sp. YQF-1]RVT42700.1 TetR/AcrR family transcriptional regulator [Rheinheimera sp. YQF-1]
MVNKTTTQDKILDAAEQLFASTGFADTSLRQITSMAQVNLAAVNYHFGSKKELIQSVLQRYLSVLMPRLDQEFSQLLSSQKQNDLTAVLSVFIKPLLELNKVQHHGTRMFLQLLGRGYTDVQGHLRWFFNHHYGRTLDKFVLLVQQACPDLPASEIFWRLHFSLGTVVFTMASNQALQEIAAADFNENVEIEGVIHRLIPYLAAGIASPLTLSSQAH